MTAIRHRYALIFERAVERPPTAVVEAHKRRLLALQRQGVVVMAGPFDAGGGLIILDVSQPAEAEEIARSDPFVVNSTHRFRLLRWLQDLGPGAVESPLAT